MTFDKSQTVREIAIQNPASIRLFEDLGIDYCCGGKRPLEVTATVDEPAGLEVDEHSIVVARYAHGLSKFETRWGTFTDPWTIQPQPKCGFVIAGPVPRRAGSG